MAPAVASVSVVRGTSLQYLSFFGGFVVHGSSICRLWLQWLSVAVCCSSISYRSWPQYLLSRPVSSICRSWLQYRLCRFVLWLQAVSSICCRLWLRQWLQYLSSSFVAPVSVVCGSSLQYLLSFLAPVSVDRLIET